MLTIREATLLDMDDLQELYCSHLAKTPPAEPQNREFFQHTLKSIVADGDYHLLVGELNGKIVSSVTLVVVKNLTHNARPYSIIENVVTHIDFRGQGFASALMARATEIAQGAGCYKIMLMTGSKKESTLRFYERCGFNPEDKTGFIKWLKN
jgi:GNAT superfamily N-acetyltransferase